LDFSRAYDPPPYDPAQAKKLLAEAGYPNGFDAGDLTPFPPFFSLAESIGGYLQAVGIRARLRTMERAAFPPAGREKNIKGGVQGTGRPRRQRGHAHRGLRDEERHLRLGGRARDRGSLPASGSRARPEEARGPARPDPADDARPGAARAHLRAGLSLGHRPARRGGLRGPHQGLLLLRTLRGPQAQARALTCLTVKFYGRPDGKPSPPITGRRQAEPRCNRPRVKGNAGNMSATGEGICAPPPQRLLCYAAGYRGLPAYF